MSGSRSRRTDKERPPLDADGAMEVAAHFLAARPRTRWELQRRMRRAAASDELIVQTLDRLATLGYVDDAAFARWWAEQRDRHAPRGRRLVESELRQHGVPREVLEELRGEELRGAELAEPALDHAALPTSEAERARVALAGHLRGRALPTERKALQRVGMYLVRRGFDPETVRTTLRAAADDQDEALGGEDLEAEETPARVRGIVDGTPPEESA